MGASFEGGGGWLPPAAPAAHVAATPAPAAIRAQRAKSRRVMGPPGVRGITTRLVPPRDDVAMTAARRSACSQVGGPDRRALHDQPARLVEVAAAADRERADDATV